MPKLSDFLSSAKIALPLDTFIPRVSGEIVAAVRSAHDVRRQAQVLLARAQRAVEIAIEEGEDTGLQYVTERRDA